jgi:hypothetical protein
VYDGSKGDDAMRDDDYDYDYHNLAENADELYENEYYYDDGSNEPWAVLDEDEDEATDDAGWDNYYHNIADEIDDD